MSRKPAMSNLPIAQHSTGSLSDILPIATPRFRGEQRQYIRRLPSRHISLPTPPPGAPNVLLVLLDDVGFGQATTFGGPANTPTLQRSSSG